MKRWHGHTFGRKDHRRNNESAVQGYTALRYYYHDVVYNPAEMVAQVLAGPGAAAVAATRHVGQAFGHNAGENPCKLRDGTPTGGKNMPGVTRAWTLKA